MEAKGIAPLVAAVALAAALGSAVAVSLAASAVFEVAPDHPLYPLKRVGEGIRGLSEEEQMKLRWQEYLWMVDKGKGLQYQGVLREFVDKLNSVAPSDRPAEVAEWIRGQQPTFADVQLRLAEEAAGGDQRLRREIERQYACWRENRDMERLRAWLTFFAYRVQRYWEVNELFENIHIVSCIQQVFAGGDPFRRFEELRSAFEELKQKVAAKMGELPREAAERLYRLALEEADLALRARDQNRLGRAVGLMTAAAVHMERALRLTERWFEWERSLLE